MNRNRRFAELAGIRWHDEIGNKVLYKCSCGFQSVYTSDADKHFSSNPDFISDPRLVLEVMREREDWIDFMDFYICISGDYIPIDIILVCTGKLLDLAIEWLEGRNKDSACLCKVDKSLCPVHPAN